MKFRKISDGKVRRTPVSLLIGISPYRHRYHLKFEMIVSWLSDVTSLAARSFSSSLAWMKSIWSCRYQGRPSGCRFGMLLFPVADARLSTVCLERPALFLSFFFFFSFADKNSVNINNLRAKKKSRRAIIAQKLPYLCRKGEQIWAPLWCYTCSGSLVMEKWNKHIFSLSLLWLIAVVTGPSQVCNGLEVAANAPNLSPVLLTNLWLAGISCNTSASPRIGPSLLISDRYTR